MANHVASPSPIDYAWDGRISTPGSLIHPPRPLYTKGLLDTAKYHPTQVSGSVGLKHRPQWDIALGAYAPLAPGARVGIYPIAA
jgi:hypothetical protein